MLACPSYDCGFPYSLSDCNIQGGFGLVGYFAAKQLLSSLLTLHKKKAIDMILIFKFSNSVLLLMTRSHWWFISTSVNIYKVQLKGFNCLKSVCIPERIKIIKSITSESKTAFYVYSCSADTACQHLLSLHTITYSRFQRLVSVKVNTCYEICGILQI